MGSSDDGRSGTSHVSADRPAAASGSAFADDLAALDGRFQAFARSYESLPIRDSIPRIREIHQHAATMLGRRPAPWQRRRLACTGARITAVRADAEFNAGRADVGRHLAASAYRLARASENAEAAAGALRVMAGIEVFEGRADRALTLARDGQRQAPRTPASAACMALEARATAAIAGPCRRDLVARAAERALEAAERLPPEQRGQPGMILDAFHPKEAGYHAVVAHAVAGQPARAAIAAVWALPELEAMGYGSFSAIARVHVAAATVRRFRPDLPFACGEVTAALRLSPRPFRALGLSLDALERVLRPHAQVAEVRTLGVLIMSWRRGEIA
jgi:hypothetical protein